MPKITSSRAVRAARTAARQSAAALLAEREAHQAIVDEADFPHFVAELIQGVFDAVVDASIEQMEAYAKLVAEVSKSVDQFMKENVEPNKGRDALTRATHSMAERQQLLATMVLMGVSRVVEDKGCGK